MGFSLQEQEIGISIIRTDDYAIIDVSDSRYIRKFDKFVESAPDVWQFYDEPTRDENGEVIARRYKAKREAIHFRARKPTRVMSDEQKAAARERMLNLAKRNQAKS